MDAGTGNLRLLVRCLTAVAVASAAVLGTVHGAAADTRERTLIDQQLGCSQNCPPSPAVFSVDGHRNAEDPNMYDITVSSMATEPDTWGVYTSGLVGVPVHLQALGNSGSAMRLVVKYRYQTDAGFCALTHDGGCVAHASAGPAPVEADPGRLPAFNNDWELGDSMAKLFDAGRAPSVRTATSESVLVLELWTIREGRESVQRVEIPFAGQALSVFPG
jgi:hypothetical protein